MVDQDGRTLLFVEMCARVVKNNLRLRLRERMRYIRCPLLPCRSALVQAWAPGLTQSCVFVPQKHSGN